MICHSRFRPALESPNSEKRQHYPPSHAGRSPGAISHPSPPRARRRQRSHPHLPAVRMCPLLPPQHFPVSPSCHTTPSAPTLMPPGSFVALESCFEEQGFEPNRPPAGRLPPVISPPPTTLQPEQPSKNPEGEDVLDFSHPPPLPVPACGLKALPTHWPGQPRTRLLSPLTRFQLSLPISCF